MTHLPRFRIAALLVGAGLLAACSGPGGAPGGDAPSTPSAQEPAVQQPAEQEPAAAPTRGTGQQEAPLPRGQALPVLTTAVAGTGSGNLVAPDTVCVFWTWGGAGAPQLAEGVSFLVDHPVVVPQSWQATHDACDDSGVPWCDGAQITADASTCQIGFVRAGTPSEHAFVGMVGTLRCTQPLSDDDCVTLAHEVDDAADVSADLDLEAVAGGDG
jgi:hypothetical protein